MDFELNKEQKQIQKAVRDFVGVSLKKMLSKIYLTNMPALKKCGRRQLIWDSSAFTFQRNILGWV